MYLWSEKTKTNESRDLDDAKSDRNVFKVGDFHQFDFIWDDSWSTFESYVLIYEIL